MVSIQEAIYYMHKEAKALYFNRVRVDLIEARKAKHPMRSKAVLLKEYRQNLARYNKIAQSYGLPFGVLLYAEVTSKDNRYGWMNTLSPGNMRRARLDCIKKAWEAALTHTNASFYEFTLAYIFKQNLSKHN